MKRSQQSKVNVFAIEELTKCQKIVTDKSIANVSCIPMKNSHFLKPLL